MKRKILYISSEAFPLIKTGGLADVAGSLPVALQQAGEDIRLLLPAYPEVLKKIDSPQILTQTMYYHQQVKLLETTLPQTEVKLWLVDCPAAFYRPGGPYTDYHGHPWHDNAFRFTILCHLAVDIALNHLSLNWTPDIVHCNDWQTGLVPALLSLHEQRPHNVFTIHNLAYQGVFDKQTFFDLHLPQSLWHMHGLEFYDNFSFIKGGLVYADKITTVSPTYAKEILRPQFGYGLSGLLQHRQADLSGILNGIDENHWNPETDPLIAANYNKETLSNNKPQNKQFLQQQNGLAIDNRTLLIGMVSRLVEQKGLDLILQAMQTLMTLPVQIIILGTGDCHFEMQLNEIAQQYPEKLKIIIGYDEKLAHQIEAGCDAYLMPSLFEPCGLNQMYSLRYATLPIVTPVGGLADTVVDTNKTTIAANTANGFVLEELSAQALFQAVQKACQLFQQHCTSPIVQKKQTVIHSVWRQLQKTAMTGDYSWEQRAREYLALYQQLK